MTDKLERFRILEVLGRGAQGEVVLAEDRARGGERVALKRFADPDLGARMAAEEFRRVADLRHPNLARALDYGRLATNEAYLTYDFVDGPAITDLADRPLGDRLRFIAAALRALAFLHARGLVHGDISPENVRVGRGDVVTLIDFGLTGPVGAAQAGGGTPLYMAPEALRAAPLDPRADVYAIGAVAYALIAGRPPVVVEAGGHIDHERIPRIDTLTAGLAPSLTEWIHGMLALSTDERFADGRAALRALRDAVDPMGDLDQAADAFALETDATFRAYVESAPRTRLVEAFDQLRRTFRPGADGPQASLALIQGALGVGKTRLVNDVARELSLDGVAVVRLAATDPEAPPYSLLSGLLDRLDDLGLTGEPTGTTRQRILGAADGDSPDALRIMALATELLFSLADARPLALVLDDLHFADASSLAVLAYLARNLKLDPRDVRGRSAGMFLIATWETSDEATSALAPLLDEAPASAPRASIEACDEAEVGGLLEAVLRTKPDPQAITWAHGLTDGNPLFVLELLGGLHGALRVPDEGLGLALTVDPSARTRVPSTLAGLIQARIEACPAPARDLLALLAVFGRPVSTRLIRHAWDRPNDTIDETIAALVDARFARHPAATPAFVEIRDRSTHAHLVESLTDEARRDWHARAGAATEACDPDDVDALAKHFLVADPTDRGRRFAERAGEEAQRIAAFPEAIDRFQSALDCTPADQAGDATRVRTKLAEVYLTTGRGNAAIRLLEAGLSETDAPSYTLLRQLGDAYALRGNHAAAVARYRDATALIARSETAERLAILARRAEAASRLGRHTAATRLGRFLLRWNPIDRDDPAIRDARKSAHRRVSLINFQRARFEDAKLHAERCLNMIDGSPLEEADVLNVIGNICLRLGSVDDARTHYGRSFELRERHGDLKGMASSLNNIGLVAGRSGDTATATDAFRRAIALQAQVGDRPGQATALNNLAVAYIVDAKIDRAIAAYEQSLAMAAELGNRQVEAMIHANLGSIGMLRGDWGLAFDHYLQSLQIRRALRTPARMAETLVNLATLLLEIGDVRRARRTVERVIRRTTRDGHTVQRIDARLVEARLDQQERAFDRSLATLKAVIQEAEERRLRPQMIEAHWAMAGHALERGRVDTARSHLDRADALTGADDHSPQSERIRLLRARVDKRSRETAGTEIIADLDALIERSQARGARPMLVDALSLRAVILQSTDPASALETYQRGADLVERMAATIPSPALHAAFHGSPRVRLLEHATRTFRQRVYLASDDPTVRVESSLRQLKANLYDVERSLDYSKSRFDKQNAGLKRILEIAHVMSATHQTTGLFELILDSIMELTEAERGFVIVRSEETDSGVQVTAARDREKADIAEPEKEISFSVVGRVLEEGRPMRIRDAAGDDIVDHTQSVLRLDLRSIMCVPLIFGSETTGVLYVENRTRTDQFTEDDLELLTIFAHQSAVALTNAELFRDLKRSLTDLRDAQERLIRQEKLGLMAEMASGVLHNFKNVLTPLLGTTQLLLADPENDRIRDDLESMERLSLECRELIRRFSNFSKGGTNLVDVVPIELHEFVEETLRDTRAKWDDVQGRIRVENEVPDELHVHANASQLREVLINLIYNAADAMPGDGGTIRVAADEDDQHVRVRVIDNGIGMTEAVRKRMFDPFFSTKKQKGMGVGMSVTYSIIQQHGGTIEVDSRLGEGTTIEIVLPRRVESETTAAPPPAPPAGRPRSILVVDDDAAILGYLKEVLTSHGYRVGTAIDAEDGRRALDGPETWDLLLTDLQMPKGSGLELAEHARRSKTARSIIVMSAQSLEVPENSPYVDAVLAKPVTMRELTDTIDRITAAPTR